MPLPAIVGTILSSVIKEVLTKNPHVPNANVQNVTEEVIETINATPGVEIVPVKPMAASKINWTQAAAIVASVAAFFGLDVSPETLVTIIIGIQAVQSVLTVILRRFSKSVVA